MNGFKTLSRDRKVGGFRHWVRSSGIRVRRWQREELWSGLRFSISVESSAALLVFYTFIGAAVAYATGV